MKMLSTVTAFIGATLSLFLPVFGFGATGGNGLEPDGLSPARGVENGSLPTIKNGQAGMRSITLPPPPSEASGFNEAAHRQMLAHNTRLLTSISGTNLDPFTQSGIDDA